MQAFESHCEGDDEGGICRFKTHTYDWCQKKNYIDVQEYNVASCPQNLQHIFLALDDIN